MVLCPLIRGECRKGDAVNFLCNSTFGYRNPLALELHLLLVARSFMYPLFLGEPACESNAGGHLAWPNPI